MFLLFLLDLEAAQVEILAELTHDEQRNRYQLELEVEQAIRTIPAQNDLNENLRTIPSQILPTKLEQIKPIASLKPGEQRQVWDKAVATANGKVPSGRIIKRISSS